MVERRRQQRMLWEGWFPEEAAGWWEPWMKHADQVLDDAELLDAVYEAQGQRRPNRRRRGRKQTSSEATLRLAVLKHVRNWSFEETEREVRANVVHPHRSGKSFRCEDHGSTGTSAGSRGGAADSSAGGGGGAREKGGAGAQAAGGHHRNRSQCALPHRQQFAGGWGTGAEPHHEEDCGGDEEGGHRAARSDAQHRTSGDGNRADQPQQRTAASGKDETRAPQAAAHDA